MHISLFKDCDTYKHIFPVDENNRKIDVYKFEECNITGLNLYYPNVLLNVKDSLILPLLERTMSLKSGTIYEKQNMTYDFVKKDVNTVCKIPVFFFIYNTDNYFHFLYDSLPYLISFLELKKEIPHLKLLMQYPNDQKISFYPFVLEFLDILGIHQDDIMVLNDTANYKEIYVSTSYTHDIDSNLPPRKEIYEFYQHIVDIVKQKVAHIETPKKIYVSRRTCLHNDFSNIGTNYTTRRKLVNEDELVEQLQQEGYTEIFTEKLTTIEKILYFANATHVIGAIGGGISNVLFSPKSTKLEAIVSPTFLDVNTRFKYSLDCVDVSYNTNTEHVEKTEFKTYMRVKTKDGKIGEIEKIYDNKLLIAYTDGSNTGWNAQNKYQQLEVNMEEVEKLDNGLNSSWVILKILLLYMKPKIALLISGRATCWEICLLNVLKNSIDYDINVFMSINNNNENCNYFNLMKKELAPYLKGVYIKEYTVPEDFINTSTHQYSVKQLVGNKYVPLNILSMWFNYKNAFDMACNYEINNQIEYDYFMVFRSDIIIDKIPLFETPKDNFLYSINQPCQFNGFGIYNVPIISQEWVYAKKNIMSVYLETYNYIIEKS